MSYRKCQREFLKLKEKSGDDYQENACGKKTP
jgi:hypothetical protein